MSEIQKCKYCYVYDQFGPDKYGNIFGGQWNNNIYYLRYENNRTYLRGMVVVLGATSW